MHRLGFLLLSFAAVVAARHTASVCGTTRETSSEALFLHHQAARMRRARPAAQAAIPAANDRDIGNIAVMEDSGGVVERLNQFNLDNSTVTFTPVVSDASRYRYTISGQSYNAPAASDGAPVIGLGDDDAREIAIPFAFSFFGTAYRKVWINSDGNLTFVTAENASSSRLTGRVTGGPPRIAALFDDLDPSRTAGGVRTWSGADRLIISWVAVPEYSDFGTGARQTFQVTLYSDGRIALAYSGANPSNAVVGIAPGSAKGPTNLVSFLNDPSAEFQSAVVERFGDTQEIDIVLVAQRFYQNHGDAYDYLVIYNNENIGAMPGALAYESTVRSSGSGWGVPPSDNARQYGSQSRLQSVLNLGQLSQYPLDPTAFVPARGASNDSPLTILGHEAGHLFLANASIPDPDDANLRPMLGFGGVHWSFVFNSEASLDEGEQITDRGGLVSPRFLTTAVTQHYSPLDQYLMGFRAPADVPDTFVVTGYDPKQVSPLWHPAGNVGFGGAPLKVRVSDLVDAEGRRTPDSTVAQRRYRFGFILITPAGSDVSSRDLQQVETYRQQFVDFYTKAADGNAAVETTLNRSLKLSVYPSAGVLAGGATNVTLSVEKALPADLPVAIACPMGFAQAPALVRIPAGSTSVSFTVTGVKPGVEELTATPVDAAFETAFARVQVAGDSQAKLTTISRAADSVTVRLSDVNDLPYRDAAIVAVATGGVVTPARVLTDDQGRASFRWDTASVPAAQLRLTAEAVPAIALTLTGGNAAASIAAVVNAATFSPGISPGSIATIFGANLGLNARVTVNGAPVTVFYASATQINFYLPPETALGTATVAAQLPGGAAPAIDVPIVAEQPGIFAVVPRTGYVEIYATGLGATQPSGPLSVTTQTPVIFFGQIPATPLFSGLAPGFVGLYQVNVAVPPGVTGTVPVVISLGHSVSNSIQVTIQ